MPPLRSATVSLICCGKEHEIHFDHDHAPALPPNRFRTNLICPACDGLLIVSLLEHPDGRQEIEQETL